MGKRCLDIFLLGLRFLFLIYRYCLPDCSPLQRPLSAAWRRQFHFPLAAWRLSSSCALSCSRTPRVHLVQAGRVGARPAKGGVTGARRGTDHPTVQIRRLTVGPIHTLTAQQFLCRMSHPATPGVVHDERPYIVFIYRGLPRVINMKTILNKDPSHVRY